MPAIAQSTSSVSDAAGRSLAMVLRTARTALVAEQRPVPQPGPGEVRLRVRACAVCRTDLHLQDGDLPMARWPIVPGHEIVGTVEACGADVLALRIGQRVGVPWLGGACGRCRYCLAGRENLCDAPQFTGCTRDGGFATHVLADAAFCVPLDGLPFDDVHAAPLLCAGLIGWRCLRRAGDARALGLYGFGAAAHLMAQVAVAQGRRVFAFTRRADDAAQQLARALGCAWAGASDDPAPEPLDAAILFAPVGALVPRALAAVRKGGRVVCGGIHMSAIPSFPYALLWEEREVVSVANLTRIDAHEFIAALATVPALQVHAQPYALGDAERALADLRAGTVHGAAVLLPPEA